MSKSSATKFYKQQPQFTVEQLSAIRFSFSYRYKIEELLNKFNYRENKKFNENVKILSEALSSTIDLQANLKARFIRSFSDYISFQDNIPIEINIKKLRYQQLTNLVDQWEISIKQPSLLRASQRLYSIQHRNILFSRVFVEQKQNIQEYFEELSEKKMLKGVDLYQLLSDILSHYFLYEFKTDNETFFQKVNSFNNFLEIVNKFLNSQRRIIIDNKSKDFEYIKLYEFEALVYFWESMNPELELRSDKRFSICSQEVQTQTHQIVLSINQEIQTVDAKEKVLNLEEIINESLKNLNKLTQVENDPQKLEMIQNICESLRKQKIKLTQYEKCKSTRKRSTTSRNVLHINSVDSRFLDANSQQSDLQLQKTERILKGYVSPDQMIGSVSNRKSDNILSLDRTMDVYSKGMIKIRVPEVEIKSKTSQKLKQTQFHSFETENINILSESSSCSETKPIKKLPDYVPQTKLRSKGQSMLRNEQLKINTQQQKSMHDQNSTNLIQQPHQEKKSILGLLQLIYGHYMDKNNQSMDSKKLNQFFVDIGIISQRESMFELKALRLNPIKNVLKIKQIEFLQIMGFIMKEDEDLTYQVILQFVDMYVKPILPKRSNTSTQNYAISKSFTSKKPQIINQEKYKYKFQNSTQKPKSKLQQTNRYPYPNQRQSALSRQKSVEGSNKKRRYMYCQQTPKFQNQDFLRKNTSFGNNFYR